MPTVVRPLTPGGPDLAQYLLTCPGCSGAAAVHVDHSSPLGPRIVRSVCGAGCAVAVDDLLGHLVQLAG